MSRCAIWWMLAALCVIAVAEGKQGKRSNNVKRSSLQLTKENAESAQTGATFHIPDSSCIATAHKIDDGNIRLDFPDCPFQEVGHFLHSYELHLNESTFLENGYQIKAISLEISSGVLSIEGKSTSAQTILPECPFKQRNRVSVSSKIIDGKRKFNVKFGLICSTLFEMTFKTKYGDPNYFLITCQKDTSNPISTSVVSILAHFGIRGSKLQWPAFTSLVVDQQQNNVAGVCSGVYSHQKMVEFSWEVTPIAAGDLVLAFQNNFHSQHPVMKAALFFRSSDSITPAIKSWLGQYHTPLFEGDPVLGLSVATHSFEVVKDKQLMGVTDKFQTGASTVTVSGGQNVLIKKRIQENQETFNGKIVNGNILLTTDAHINSTFHEHLRRFYTISSTVLYNKYPFLEPVTTVSFVSVMIENSAAPLIHLTVNITETIEMLPGISGIAGLTWKLRCQKKGEKTGMKMLTYGKVQFLGEDLNIKFENGGDGPRIMANMSAYSLEQLLGNSGVNVSQIAFYEPYMHLFKAPVSTTYMYIDLVLPQRSLRFESQMPSLGGVEQVANTKVWSHEGTLRSYTRFLSEHIPLHKAMETIFEKKVIKQSWISMRSFGAKLGYNSHPSKIGENGLWITGHVDSLSICNPGETVADAPRTLCGFFKGRIPAGSRIEAEATPSAFDLPIRSETGEQSFVLERGDVVFTVRALNVLYANHNSSITAYCSFRNHEYITGVGIISAVGNGIPILRFHTTTVSHNLLKGNEIHVGWRTAGVMFLDGYNEDTFTSVFESGVSVGYGNSMLHFDTNVMLSVRSNNHGQMVARRNTETALHDVLAAFGESTTDVYLRGATFVNGFVAMYCSKRTPGCMFSGVDGIVTTTLRISGTLYIPRFGITVDARYEKRAGELYIQAQLSVVTGYRGVFTLEGHSVESSAAQPEVGADDSETDAQTDGPTMKIRGPSERNPEGYCNLRSHLVMPGVARAMLFYYLPKDGGHSFYATANTKWYGESNAFTFEIFANPRPDMKSMRLKVNAKMKEDDLAVDNNAMVETAQHYINLAKKCLLQRSATAQDLVTTENSLLTSIDLAKADLKQAEEKLADLAEMFKLAEKTMHEDCLSRCEKVPRFGVHVDPTCTDIDSPLACISWEDTKEQVIDFACVAECEGHKIIERGTVDNVWKTGLILLPNYEELIGLSHFLEEVQVDVTAGSNKITTYLDGVNACTSSILPKLKEFLATRTGERFVITSLNTSYTDEHFIVRRPCYKFIIDFRGTQDTFDACFNGNFYRQLTVQIFKMENIDLDTLNNCLRDQNGPYTTALEASQLIAAKVQKALKEANSNSHFNSEKRHHIKANKLGSTSSRFQHIFSQPAGNVQIKSSQTVQAFHNQSPWAVNSDMHTIKEHSKEAMRRSFNASFVPGSQHSCEQTKHAAKTYSALTNSMRKMANSYYNGKVTIERYKKNVEGELDRREINLFRRCANQNPSTYDLKDMMYWVKQSRKGSAVWGDKMSETANFHNRNAIGILKSQIQNYLAKAAPQMSLSEYVSAIGGSLNIASKRGHIPEDILHGNGGIAIHTRNMISMLSSKNVLLEDARDAINSMWSHGKELTSNIRCA